jgi:hypothetical protein
MTTGGGSLTSIGGLGQGFNGGLAHDPVSGSLYAIANDFLGNSTLYSVSAGGVPAPLGPVGVGFYGGLTFNADDGMLYAMAGDAFGVMRRVMAIDIGTAAATPLFDLADGSLGFNGGLAYDDVADLFYVIGNDFLANSALFTFTLAGAGADLTALDAAFGQGFLNVGLALGPEVTPPPPPAVSEPPSAALLLLAASVGLVSRRHGARRRACSQPAT